MKSIKLDSLQGYQIDDKTKDAFLRRYKNKAIYVFMLGSLGAIAAGALGAFLMDSNLIIAFLSMTASVCFLLYSLISFIDVAKEMKSHVPVSLKSGKKMEVYRLSLASPGDDEKDELIYICHESRSYFRFTYSERGDSFYNA